MYSIQNPCIASSFSKFNYFSSPPTSEYDSIQSFSKKKEINTLLIKFNESRLFKNGEICHLLNSSKTKLQNQKNKPSMNSNSKSKSKSKSILNSKDVSRNSHRNNQPSMFLERCILKNKDLIQIHAPLTIPSTPINTTREGEVVTRGGVTRGVVRRVVVRRVVARGVVTRGNRGDKGYLGDNGDGGDKGDGRVGGKGGGGDGGDDDNGNGGHDNEKNSVKRLFLSFYKETNQNYSNKSNQELITPNLFHPLQYMHSLKHVLLLLHTSPAFASFSSSHPLSSLPPLIPFPPSLLRHIVRFFSPFLVFLPLLHPSPSRAQTSASDQTKVNATSPNLNDGSEQPFEFKICENRGSRRTCYSVSSDNELVVRHESNEGEGEEEEKKSSLDSHGFLKPAESRKEGKEEDDQKTSTKFAFSIASWSNNVKKMVLNILLPSNFPNSVTDDYFEYTLWRMGQGIASEANRVLTTQALLFAIGLGKGAIPTAAALNWVLKDGIGYISKIALSQFGKQFDVNPKGSRFLADVAEDLSCGFELLTPAFPSLFVPLAALAGAGLSGSGLVQAATRSCFYAGFAAKRNFADLIAKGEAQGMVSKCCGIGLGIFLSSRTGAVGLPLFFTYLSLTSFHLFCNLKSYQAVTLRTLNTYRATLVFGEFLHSAIVPSVKEVNREEPFFPSLMHIKLQHLFNKTVEGSLSEKTKAMASKMHGWIEFGSSLSVTIKTKKDLKQLEEIYHDEKYMLSIQGNKGRVILKKDVSPNDLLRCLLQSCYLMKDFDGLDLNNRSNLFLALKNSHETMNRTFDEVREKINQEGWKNDGLVAKLGPYRLLECTQTS